MCTLDNPTGDSDIIIDLNLLIFQDKILLL